MLSAEKMAVLAGHGNPVFTLALSQKPGILFSGGNDKGLVEWSLDTNSFIRVLFNVSSSIYSIHAPAGFPYLFAGLRNGDIVGYHFGDRQPVKPLRYHTLPVFDVKSVNRKKELLAASEDGTVTVWDLQTLTLLYAIRVSADTVRCISISADEKQVAFGCRDNSIKIYDLDDYTLIGELAGHTMSVFSLSYDPSGMFLVSGGRDAQLKIWDTSGFSLIANIPAHLFAVNSICFHSSKPYFATASMDKSIKIWGADDFKLRKIISREKGYAAHALSVNKILWFGDRLISASDDKQIIEWEIKFDA